MDALYIGSFPPEERRDWDLVMRLADDEPMFDFNVIMADGRPAGFITVWHLGPVRYVEHFVTDPQLRGAGIGAEVIKALINASAIPVILEVEPQSAGEMACRRIGFYSRNGMIPHHDFAYIQPPYRDGLPSVELTLMTSSPSVDLHEAAALIHRHVYGVV